MSMPILRFPEFGLEWEELQLGKYIDEYKERSTEHNQYEVFTSARQGLMLQTDYYDNERITDRKNIGFNIVPPDYLTYRSRSDNRRFYFNENTLGKVGIISVYYPVFRIKNGSNKFFKLLLFKHIQKIGKYSVGTSQTVLSMSALKSIKLPIPTKREQKKIAAFLGAVDDKLSALKSKRDLLGEYKRGLMQKLFSQQLRFTQPNGQPFPDWEEKRLGDVLQVKGKRNSEDQYKKSDVLSVSGEYGIVNQIEHLGRSYAGQFVDNYHVVDVGDVVYTKSPLKANPYGIIKANKKNAGIVSTLYAVYEVKEGNSYEYIDRYFEIDANTNRYLRPLVQKGAKNDMKISNERVLIDKLTFPSFDEQQKIADVLSALDAKITAVADQVIALESFKKGLLQQMFV